MAKQEHYSLTAIKKYDAHYNIIFGERSNGKTYACLEEGLDHYQSSGGREQFAYIRRWDEDIRPKRMTKLFAGHVESGCIPKMFKKSGWNNMHFYGGEFHLCKYEEDGSRTTDTTACGYVFSLSAMEHDKSVSYPNVTTIIMDEFLTRGMYLPDEFVTLMNVLSTLIRGRTGIKIYLLGNTVNKWSPYFDEFGLTNIPKMKPGDIDLYRYGDSELKVAVQYADSPSKAGKPSDVYFAFNNPKLQMIKSGAWEMAMYPHNRYKYKPKDIMWTYFIEHQDELLQCDIIYTDEVRFTMIHRKTTPIQHPDEDMIFSLETNAQPNYRRNISKPYDKIGKKIYAFFVQDLVYYQNNEIGEIVRNYLIACRSDAIIKA